MSHDALGSQFAAFGMSRPVINMVPREAPTYREKFDELPPEHPGSSSYARQVPNGVQLPLHTPHWYPSPDEPMEVAMPEEAAHRYRAANMPSHREVASTQYKDFHLNYVEGRSGNFHIEATHPGLPYPAGGLHSGLEEDDHEPSKVNHVPLSIHVETPHQKKGLARAMFRFGQFMSGDLQHSRILTDEGEGYSAHVPDNPSQDPARKPAPDPLAKHPRLF